MAKKRYAVVIEIGADNLKIVTFDAANNKLMQAAVKDISFIKDEAQKLEFVKTALKETVAEDILKRAWTILCLSEDSVQIKRLDLPVMPSREVIEAIKWRIKGIIPFEVDKALLDYDMIGEATDEDGARKTNIIVAAVDRTLVDKKVSLLKDSGISLVSGANVDSFALSNIIDLLPEGKKENTCAVLKIDYTRSVLNIYGDGRLAFARNIPLGLNSIRESIKSPVAKDTGMIELAAEEEEELKKIGIPDTREMLLGGKLEGKHLLALIRSDLNNLVSEIQRSFDYYNVQLEGKRVSKLYIAGDGSAYRNLDRFIRDAINVDTEYIKVPDSFLDKENTKEIVPQIAPLLGAARAGINGKVNILPVEYRREKVQELQKSSIRLFGITVLTIFIVSFMLVKIRVNDYKDRLETAKEHNKVLYKLKELYDKVEERENLINAVRSLEVSTVAIMKEISNIMPQNIVLQNLEIDQTKGSVYLKGVVYTGNGVGEVMVAELMDTIEKSQFFKEVNLETSEKGTIEDQKAAFFTIGCAVQK